MENVVYRKYIRETFVEKNIYILMFLKRVYLGVYQRKNSKYVTFSRWR